MSKMRTQSSRPKKPTIILLQLSVFPFYCHHQHRWAGSNEVFFPDSMSHINRDPSFVPQNCNTTSFDNDTHVGVRSCPRDSLPDQINPRFGIILFPLLAAMGFLDASIPIAMESATWRSGGLIYAIVHWSCVSQPIYAIIPHNVVCAVVVVGFAVDILLIRLTRSLHLIKILSCQSKTFGVYCLLLFFIIIILRVIINSWVKVIMII
jgi:hypothetical protein